MAWPLNLRYLNGVAEPCGHTRRRHGGRRRHPQRAHDPQHTAAPERTAGAAVIEVRGEVLMYKRDLERLNRAQRDSGREGIRQSPQRRRGRPAAARCAVTARAAPALFRVRNRASWSVRRSRKANPPCWTGCRTLGVPYPKSGPPSKASTGLLAFYRRAGEADGPICRTTIDGVVYKVDSIKASACTWGSYRARRALRLRTIPSPGGPDAGCWTSRCRSDAPEH